MPEGPTEADLERVIAILNRHEVNFIGTSDNPISYEALRSRAHQARDGELVVVIASLDDIIAAKEAADRPKDHEALPELRALQHARDAQS